MCLALLEFQLKVLALVPFLSSFDMDFPKQSLLPGQYAISFDQLQQRQKGDDYFQT